ncbi:hypothetical protein Q2T83_07875 [Fervidibacter sacchari]|uniref:Uncharacterized protein n=1 Tax=Candidatus Fervidibacter sacchari TaxID=1448929 RepID=A0ABT2EM28_9BACT|nr:hypothetical protein [Candidatus Fervidibacter sacchari]MCS3918506.1 hypothetical protein [Candidatus Fervidibacter sacchari]WKU17727.1 hypothetical protein Q2T83_07875 [Candidatus Fervidibacter sacchari]
MKGRDGERMKRRDGETEKRRNHASRTTHYALRITLYGGLTHVRDLRVCEFEACPKW